MSNDTPLVPIPPTGKWVCLFCLRAEEISIFATSEEFRKHISAMHGCRSLGAYCKEAPYLINFLYETKKIDSRQADSLRRILHEVPPHLIAHLLSAAIIGMGGAMVGIAIGSRKAQPPPGPEPVIVNPADGAEMILIPAGEFIMGTNEAEIESVLCENPGWEREWFKNETPQHRVYLDAYRIYKNPVTVAQFRRYCVEASRKMPEPPNWGWMGNHPVVNVNWVEAQAYCRWAGTRLPTEAEWEKAARGTDGQLYPWGNSWEPAKCNNSESGSERTTPVGDYPNGASPYGCQDMAGNVLEWCADWYAPYDPSEGKNPTGPKEGPGRVLRGGSWSTFASDSFRCANRIGGALPRGRSIRVGFRCAKTS